MLTIAFNTLKNKKLRILDAPRVGCWVHAVAPTDAEIAQLAALPGADEVIIRDVLDPHEVPRIEVEGDVTYVFTRVPCKIDGTDAATGGESTVPFLIALGPSYILTIAERTTPLLDRFLHETSPIVTTQKARTFLQFFGAVATTYDRHVMMAGKRVRAMSASMEERFDNRYIAQFILWENVLNDFLAALGPTVTLLRRLLGSGGPRFDFHASDKELVEDLLVDTQQMEEMCRATLRYLVNVRTGYEAMQTNALNRTIRALTALTVALTLPMIVGGFFGMNVPVPIAASPHAFPLIIIGTMALMTVTLVVFHRNKWL